MKITIVIPTYNEEKELPFLLESIKKNNTQKDYEIIIADAHSQDNTRKIAKKYDCKIVDGGLPAKGRNQGAQYATGDLIYFIDADSILPQDYLENTSEEFLSKNLSIAITRMQANSDKNTYKILHNISNILTELISKFKAHGAGCYGIITTPSIHHKLEGFNQDLDFGEDTDYIERAAKLGRFGVLKSSKIIVSVRRLEEDGLLTLIKQYGKSTINDIRGKRTKAEDIEYGFNHK